MLLCDLRWESITDYMMVLELTPPNLFLDATFFLSHMVLCVSNFGNLENI